MCVINNDFSPIKLVYFDRRKKPLEIREQCQDLNLFTRMEDIKHIPFIHTLIIWRVPYSLAQNGPGNLTFKENRGHRRY